MSHHSPNKKRKTKKQREQELLAEFEQALVELAEPRRRQGIRYPLRSVVTIGLMAMVCGADDAQAMQLWGEANEEWLDELLDLPHGTPTQDVFLAVFAALNPEEFSQVFAQWVKLLLWRKDGDAKHIAIDGKTNRRTFDKANNQPAVHVVSAWLRDEGLVLGQISTDKKSNEITAIPDLLRLIDLRGATVTIDAMGCQTKIAEEIVRQGGDYLLAVKDNQPTLAWDIELTFADALDSSPRTDDHSQPLLVETTSETTKGHGRVEERTVHVCRDLSFLTTANRWPGLALVAMVVSTRTDRSTGKFSTERRYYIGSDTTASAVKIAKVIRRHWGIENELHWVLDMAFNEDQARHRAGNCAKNFATLRHFAINLIRGDKKTKLGIANKRKRAGWDRSYLLQLLAGDLS